jgi:putative ABC transport system substrate-binding protein
MSRPGLLGRRAALCAMGGLAAAPLPVRSQPAVRQVGFLHPANAEVEVSQPRLAPFAEGLRQRGFVEGRNVSVIARWGQYDTVRMATYVREFARPGIDAILAVGRETVQQTRAATSTIPIVALDLESDPVQSGFVESLSRPGGNVTGLFFDFPEFSGKLLQLLGEIILGLSRVAILWDPGTGPVQLEALKSIAAQRGLTLKVIEVATPRDIDDAFRVAAEGKVQAVMALFSTVFGTTPKQVADTALRYRLPTITPFPEYGRVGGLVAYGVETSDLFRQAGELTGKVLAGARPADLPVERPSRFRLVVNLRTARELGITLASMVLLTADEVIE